MLKHSLELQSMAWHPSSPAVPPPLSYLRIGQSGLKHDNLNVIWHESFVELWISLWPGSVLFLSWPVSEYKPSPGVLEFAAFTVLPLPVSVPEEGGPALCMSPEQTGPPVYGVRCPDWIQPAAIAEKLHEEREEIYWLLTWLTVTVITVGTERYLTLRATLITFHRW